MARAIMQTNACRENHLGGKAIFQSDQTFIGYVTAAQPQNTMSGSL